MMRLSGSLGCLFLISSLTISCAGPMDSAERIVVGLGNHSNAIQYNPYYKVPEWQRPADCRANIATALCEVNDTVYNKDPLSVVCDGDGRKYLKKFEAVYDNLDTANKKMFCSVRRIFVEKNTSSTAFATSLTRMTDEGEVEKLPGAIIGFRRSFLDDTPRLDAWLTWKEQLNFTELPKDGVAVLNFPRVETKGKASLLDYIVIHEFAHLYDFANDINTESYGNKNCLNEVIESADDYYSKCRPYYTAGTWGEISWKDSRTVLTKSLVLGRKWLCFYDCVRYASSEEMRYLYKSLSESEFVTSYGATNPYDDLAETMAIDWMVNTMGDNITIVASDDLRVDSEVILKSDKVKQKRDYLERLKKQELLYP